MRDFRSNSNQIHPNQIKANPIKMQYISPVSFPAECKCASCHNILTEAVLKSCCGVSCCLLCSREKCAQCSVDNPVIVPNLALRKMVTNYHKFNTSLDQLKKAYVVNPNNLAKQLQDHFKWAISHSARLSTEDLCAILEAVATVALVPDNHHINYGKELKSALVGIKKVCFISTNPKTSDATEDMIGDGLKFVAVETSRARITVVFS